MPAKTIIRPSNVDTNNFNFSDVNVNERTKAKNVWINYGTSNQKLVMQTGKMPLSRYALDVYTDEKSGTKSYSIKVPCDPEANKDISDVVTALEGKVKAHAVANADKFWPDKKGAYTAPVVEAIFKSSIKTWESKKNPGQKTSELRLKLPRYDGKWSFKTFLK